MARHREHHVISRIGWLRAAVLGANDGIVSTASLMIGVGASGASRSTVLLTGAAGLVAGAMSMAAGEYVSVSSQSDTEQADLAREKQELVQAPQAELDELTNLYLARGVDPDTARRAAMQMMAHDALGAHARDELHITELTTARPVIAAFTSAVTFTAGAQMPLLIAVLAPRSSLVASEAIGSLLVLGTLGTIGAVIGGAKIGKPVARVVFWGALAMAVTAVIGRLVGAAV